MAPRNAEASGSKSKPPAASTASGATESDLIARSKKRRIPGACDICKRKKGDSGELPGNRCSNCIQLGLECTHKEVTKTLGSAKGYVESLEARLEKMDKLLRRLLPGVDLNQEVGSVVKTPEEPPSSRLLVTPEEEQEVLGKLNTLTLKPHSHRFFGKSSQYDLLQTALDLREEFTGEGLAYVKPSLPMQRPEFWDVPKWMTYNPEIDEEERNYVFPDDDLYPSLIDAYFSRINPFHPLLHQPTFEAQVASGLHRRDSMFAKVFLLVCAHGARFSDDPRVLAEGTTSARSSGWKWFEQVNIMRRNLFNRTVLHELQMHARSFLIAGLQLYVLYAGSSEMPQGVWAQIGMALRLSQEVGGHRRRRNKDSGLPTAEDELWKRAFWVILSMDRWISQFSGRPCGLQDEDFDLDLPLEVDDEYWESGFSQPEGQPSSMAYFNSYLSLMDILAYAMRLIYSTKRSKFARKGSERSEQETIAELDAAMNSWMDSVPEHLRWNAQHKSPLFIKQSSALHATYYWLQIFIHRPFIPSPRNPTSGAFPSLAICTNAARSACHVLETFHKLDTLPHQPFQAIIFSAAAILLLNIWSGKRSGFAPNPRRELEDVQRCMDMLRASETRDLLNELASAGDLGSALTQNEVKSKSRRKRSRSDTEAEDTDSSSSSSSMPTMPPAVPLTRNIAGTRRVSISQQSNNPSSPVEPPINFLLPMYSNDLGRLPVYGQFNFADTANVNAFLGDQLGQIHTSIPTKTSNSYHFDQPPNPAAASNLLDMTSDATANYFSDNYMLDSMIKDAVFNSSIPTPIASTSASGDVAGDGTTPRPPGMSAADVATLFAQCSTDFGALTQHLGPFGPHQPIIDPEMMKMWNNAPASLELDEWGTFISNVGQLTQSKRSSPALP
ncbi:hypothetical protein D9611_013298 [Ephemerocybe angulata]|uniref:Zn(2)-C6 fungal-type domain-containing protein n=1 Tax=Ephemerocybe angulata TaxID=980116 RepID=A0A8H5CB70_9AGAR|nr:hypothetical protein D9611_013298 [Tulosesus angulatus]